MMKKRYYLIPLLVANITHAANNAPWIQMPDSPKIAAPSAIRRLSQILRISLPPKNNPAQINIHPALAASPGSPHYTTTTEFLAACKAHDHTPTPQEEKE